MTNFFWFFRKINRRQAGMTYVELIVVLSIFAIVTGTVIFNYKEFQAKVDIKNLANDIALKVVEAQKNSVSGKIPFGKTIPPNWKPSYGIFFDPTPDLSPDPNTGNKVFYYFADVFPDPPDKKYDQLYNCPLGECIEKFRLTKGNFITDVMIYYYNASPESVDNAVSITFTRPDSTMTIKKNSGPALANVDYITFRVESPQGPYVDIKIYTSGRIEIL